MIKATRLGRPGTYIARLNLVQASVSSLARFPPRTLGSVATGRSIYSGSQEPKTTLKPGDPSYEGINISELWGKYRLGKSDLTIDGSKTKEDVATVAFASEISKLAGGFTGSAIVDVGDPLGCDSAEMRSAKARSQYAWVTCETELERYILQAQDIAYFFVERDPGSEDQQYNLGYAHAFPTMKIDQPFTCNIDQYWFRFQPKVMFPGTKTLDKAIERADLLVGKVLEDGWLQNILKRDAAWRLKPCSLRQLNMLRRMQEAYNLKYAERLAEDKLYFCADALEMTNGQLSDLLTAILHTHFDPADGSLHGGKSYGRGDVDERSAEIVSLPRPDQVRLAERCNNFWEGR